MRSAQVICYDESMTETGTTYSTNCQTWLSKHRIVIDLTPTIHVMTPSINYRGRLEFYVWS